jgi:hypothetical protein
LYVKADPKMDERMFAAHLALKGASTRAAHEDLNAIFGRNAVAYISVTHNLRKAHVLPSSQDAPSADVHRGIDDADQALLAAFDEQPFASVRQLSRLTRTPTTTVYCRLTESPGFTARHLQWAPHPLSDAEKACQIDLSRQLLRMLEVQRNRAWHGIVILDEFRLIDVLAKGRQFNLAYCTTEIPSLSSKWPSAGTKGEKRKLIIHADNSRSHTARLVADRVEGL